MEQSSLATGSATEPSTNQPYDDVARVNVGDGERLGSVLGGGALALLGLNRALRRGSFGGWVLAAVGGGLLYRGLSGRCLVYAALGINRATGDRTVTGNLGIKIDRSVTVNAPPDQVYGYWRDFENLPRIISHLERVQVVGGSRSRWTVKTPAGMKVEWEAETIKDRPNEVIAWRSLPNALVEHAGSVHFKPAPDGNGTIVRVSLQYDPPLGQLGQAVASLFGDDTGRQVEDDLTNFKHTIEAGLGAA